MDRARAHGQGTGSPCLTTGGLQARPGSPSTPEAGGSECLVPPCPQVSALLLLCFRSLWPSRHLDLLMSARGRQGLQVCCASQRANPKIPDRTAGGADTGDPGAPLHLMLPPAHFGAELARASRPRRAPARLHRLASPSGTLGPQSVGLWRQGLPEETMGSSMAGGTYLVVVFISVSRVQTPKSQELPGRAALEGWTLAAVGRRDLTFQRQKRPSEEAKMICFGPVSNLWNGARLPTV